MDVDYVSRVVTLNIAYYGPPLSGRGTNVEQLKRSIDGSGQLVLTANNAERTLRVILPSKDEWPKLKAFTVRVHLHAPSGFRQDFEAVLNGKDGIVFVADSAPQRQDANARFFAAAAWHPAPVVVQLNKRDLSDAVPAEAMMAPLLRIWPAAKKKPVVVEAAAKDGRGVLETYREILKALA